MGRPEARGSSRKPTEATNSITLPRIRIFHQNLALELWYAVADPLTWEDRRRRFAPDPAPDGHPYFYLSRLSYRIAYLCQL